MAVPPASTGGTVLSGIEAVGSTVQRLHVGAREPVADLGTVQVLAEPHRAMRAHPAPCRSSTPTELCRNATCRVVALVRGHVDSVAC